jgi:hypothetical protein
MADVFYTWTGLLVSSHCNKSVFGALCVTWIRARTCKDVRTLSSTSCRFPVGSTSHAHFAPTTAGTIGTISRLWPQNNRLANQITRPGMQPPIMTQIQLSITKVTLALAPKSSILNKPHPPPLILARQPVSDNHCRDLCIPAPGNWWTHSLKIKLLLVIYSGWQRITWEQPSRYDIPWIYQAFVKGGSEIVIL